MQITEALADPNLFGALPCFADLTSWGPWVVFLKAVYGLPLDADERVTFEQHTGRTIYAPPPGGWREAVCIVGRQSGKTRVASLLATYEAITAKADANGGEIYCTLVAQDHRAALRALFSYVTATFDASDLLRSAIANRTQDTITLKTGVRIAAYPCRAPSVRGLRARSAVCDELAFYRSSDGNPADTEMLRALRPTLATTGGRLVMISSPYGQAGALWDTHRRHYGRDDSPVLVWQASAPEMNPTLPADYLARMAEDDPEAYRSEVLGEFRAGVATLFDPETLDAAIVRDRKELLPTKDVRYCAFVDPSGGALRCLHARDRAPRRGSGRRRCRSCLEVTSEPLRRDRGVRLAPEAVPGGPGRGRSLRRGVSARDVPGQRHPVRRRRQAQVRPLPRAPGRREQ
jgi:hypothetical protein